MRHHHHHDDERRIVGDGEHVRVPMFAMDADPVQRAIAAALHDGNVRVTDGSGGSAGLHRPGYRLPTHDGGDERRVAYALYDAELSNAWRGPVSDTRRKKVQGRDPQGRETGTWEEETDDAAPPVVRDGMTLDEAERIHRQRMAREYQAYDHWIADQWRNR